MRDPDVLGVYRPTALYVLFLGLLIVGCPLVFVCTCGGMMFSTGLPIVLAAGYLGGVYMLLFLLPMRLELTATELRWRAPLRSCRMPLHSVRSVRQTGGSVVIKGSRQKLRLMNLAATDHLVGHICAVAPHVRVVTPWRPRPQPPIYRYEPIDRGTAGGAPNDHDI
jgi:hypothetical protein